LVELLKYQKVEKYKSIITNPRGEMKTNKYRPTMTKH